MDSSSMSSSSGCKKLKVDENVDAAHDRISALHDMVLRHILSFLPTPDAVRTCVLSKRFDNMWTSLPNLCFELGSDLKPDKFMNFVERVLTHHDFSSLHDFTLECAVRDDVTRISTWISAAIRRKVQVLHIKLFDITASLVLPLSLFNSNSLEKLELSMSHDLKLPTSICFPSLKKLALRDLIFPNGDLAQKLFSGCPALEELDIDDCSWENHVAVSISCPKLKRFTISEFQGEGDNECEITILSTSLEFFQCHGELRNEYFFSSTSSLVHTCLSVSIDDHLEDEAQGFAYRFQKFLKIIPNTTRLGLSSSIFEVYNSPNDLFIHVPVFKSLTHLDFNLGAVELDLEGPHSILQNSPHLKSLYFAGGVRLRFENPEKVDQILCPVPSCFTSDLKVVKVDKFTGSMNEIVAVKILLSYAAVLEKMVIGFGFGFYLSSNLVLQQQIQELVMLLPRSPSCSVIFI